MSKKKKKKTGPKPKPFAERLTTVETGIPNGQIEALGGYEKTQELFRQTAKTQANLK